MQELTASVELSVHIYSSSKSINIVCSNILLIYTELPVYVKQQLQPLNIMKYSMKEHLHTASFKLPVYLKQQLQPLIVIIYSVQEHLVSMKLPVDMEATAAYYDYIPT